MTMKIKIDIYTVTVSSYYGDDRLLDCITETFQTREEAEKCVEKWLLDDSYAREPDDEGLKGRVFEVKKEHNNVYGSLQRVTDNPEEFFFRDIYLFHSTVEKDVPLVFDMKDIKRIQLFTD